MIIFWFTDSMRRATNLELVGTSDSGPSFSSYSQGEKTKQADDERRAALLVPMLVLWYVAVR